VLIHAQACLCRPIKRVGAKQASEVIEEQDLAPFMVTVYNTEFNAAVNDIWRRMWRDYCVNMHINTATSSDALPAPFSINGACTLSGQILHLMVVMKTVCRVPRVRWSVLSSIA
jgi:hypothetical protein